jgi:hypothetical protein
MFSAEVIELLMKVITTWQVIAITIGIILYVNIVNYVAKNHYHRPKMPKKFGFKKKKTDAAAVAAAPAEGVHDDGGEPASSNDELGLEES